MHVINTAYSHSQCEEDHPIIVPDINLNTRTQHNNARGYEPTPVIHSEEPTVIPGLPAANTEITAFL